MERKLSREDLVELAVKVLKCNPQALDYEIETLSQISPLNFNEELENENYYKIAKALVDEEIITEKHFIKD